LFFLAVGGVVGGGLVPRPYRVDRKTTC
jgi:hypothetical protein